jgi:hypothetical protein
MFLAPAVILLCAGLSLSRLPDPGDEFLESRKPAGHGVKTGLYRVRQLFQTFYHAYFPSVPEKHRRNLVCRRMRRDVSGPAFRGAPYQANNPGGRQYAVKFFRSVICLPNVVSAVARGTMRINYERTA